MLRNGAGGVLIVSNATLCVAHSEERTVMEIEVRYIEGTCVIDVSGSVDMYTAQTLKDAVGTALERQCIACILNMKKTTSLDSSGIGVLISLNAKLSRNGMKLYVVGVPNSIMSVLEITRTIDLLSTKDTVIGALSDLEAKAC
jgi:anti-sigma B factor antagonist